MFKQALLASVTVLALTSSAFAFGGDDANGNDRNRDSVIGNDNDVDSNSNNDLFSNNDVDVDVNSNNDLNSFNDIDSHDDVQSASFDRNRDVTSSVLNATIAASDVDFKPAFGADYAGNNIEQGAFVEINGITVANQNTGINAVNQQAVTVSIGNVGGL
jgi:hypothetical protein